MKLFPQSILKKRLERLFFYWPFCRLLIGAVYYMKTILPVPHRIGERLLN